MEPLLLKPPAIGDVAVISFVMRFGLATLGVMGVALTQRWYNKLTGDRFNASFKAAEQSPEGLRGIMNYYAARVLGVLLFYGLVLG